MARCGALRTRGAASGRTPARRPGQRWRHATRDAERCRGGARVSRGICGGGGGGGAGGATAAAARRRRRRRQGRGQAPAASAVPGLLLWGQVGAWIARLLRRLARRRRRMGGLVPGGGPLRPRLLDGCLCGGGGGLHRGGDRSRGYLASTRRQSARDVRRLITQSQTPHIPYLLVQHLTSLGHFTSPYTNLPHLNSCRYAAAATAFCLSESGVAPFLLSGCA